MREIAIAKVDDLNNGQMQQITVEDSQILLSKINDKFYATSAFCTHYGAPLAKGILCGEKIICPWHNACFNAIAGQQLEPPGLDSLVTFTTIIQGDEVLIKLPETVPQQRTLAMAKYIPQSDQRTLIILGGGIAGINAAEVLRQEGYQGKIILISAEAESPYDRTKLTKNYLQNPETIDSLSLRSSKFYQEHDIELHLGKLVTKVDAINKSLTFSDDSTLEYDSLLLATGAKARSLDLPGADLANIFTIRQPQDVHSILAAAEGGKRAIVIGSSFIGMEAAASLIQHDLTVTVISPSDVPFKKVLGNELGQMFKQVHQNHGITFKSKTKAIEFKGDKQVASVVLDNGEELEADVVIMGVGVELNTDFIAGIELNQSDKSVEVNQYLQTEIEDIYAAGDIARFPYQGKPTRIEHWRLAAQQGRIAAINMTGKQKPQSIDSIVPFFWSGQYDLKLRYVGHAEQWDEVYLYGNLDLDQPEFLAFYCQADQVLAVAGINRDRDIAAISELMHQHKMPAVSAIKSQQIDWLAML